MDKTEYPKIQDLINELAAVKKELSDVKTASLITQKELKDSYKIFMTLYENTLDCIFIYNVKEEKVVQANKAAYNLFKFSKEEFIGLNRFEIIPQYHNAIPGIDLQEAHRQGQLELFEKGSFQTKTIFYDKYQNTIFADFFAIPTGNNPNECFIILKNTTNEILSRKKLREANKEMDAKNVMLQKYIESNMQLENFAYLASHDLRTPLQNIINFSNLLGSNKNENFTTVQQNYLKIIKEGAHRMQDTIQDLLKFSLVSSQDLLLKGVDTSKLIKELNIDLKYLITRHNVKFEFKNLPTQIRADEGLLRQLLQNLISNAIKFSKHLQQPIIEIGAKSTPDKHVFYVKDNGIGIDEKDQANIFVIFKRIHNNINYEGTGIGLALCKAVIEKHNGELWVESKLGEGACFYFSIPK
jgi:signal transduction histidine kinase